MKRPVYSPASKQDLVEIGLYIARDNPTRAISFVRELKTQCRKIAETPQAYRSRPALGADIRSCPYGNYVIFFTAHTRPVQIVRILYGAMDAETLFSSAPA